MLGKPRFGYSTPAPSSAFPAWRRGLSTGVSATIKLAMDSLAKAPFPSVRQVINICANGVDNVAEGPDFARAHALTSGAVIIGLFMGDHPDVAIYFRERVRGGVGSFVIETRQFDDVLDAMLTKFPLDLVSDMPEVDPDEPGPAWDQLPTRLRDSTAAKFRIESLSIDKLSHSAI